MNFLYRNAQPVVLELPAIPENEPNKDLLRKPSTTLEGLIAGDPFPSPSQGDADVADDADVTSDADVVAGERPRNQQQQLPEGNHSDVAEDEGCITIPCKELPDDWSDVSDMMQLRSLDRSFIFPGEQVHILVCLSALKQEMETITPFKVASTISKNGNHQTDPSENGKANGENIEKILKKYGETHIESPIKNIENNGKISLNSTKSENLLERFRNSNFFVRIAQSDEPLWSRKKRVPTVDNTNTNNNNTNNTINNNSNNNNYYLCNAISDKGYFDGTMSGGVARDIVKCISLKNGDIVVLLRVNIGVTNLIKDPTIEILQFEKHQQSPNFSLDPSNDSNQTDPCHELLNWLLPLDRTLTVAPPPRSLSPTINPPPTVSHKPSFSASSTSQIFSFGNFRSYSMPTSVPQVSTTPPPSISKPATPPFDLEEFDNVLLEKSNIGLESGSEAGQLSFRGVPLERERYSVRCGLDGVYLPGRKWRRRVEIVQPVEVHSFTAKCTTENLLCVQVKNIAPAHLPNIVIYVDSLTIVFERAPKGGTTTSSSLSLPIASIEAGDGHSLPNLPLRRGEEHSFILKPATTINSSTKGNYDFTPSASHSKLSSAATITNLPPRHRVGEMRNLSPVPDQYVVLVSYRSNYTESKLLFKQATSWQPSIARDVMISVSSEPYNQTIDGPSARVPQLPVQVLTLEATNLTNEDLTLTVLAPEPSASPLSVLALNSAPVTPASSVYNESPEGSDNNNNNNGNNSNKLLSNGSGCTHLWLQSAVPLGCVSARSSATVKLELLPLTDGIITLNTLQITIKEKGITYIPEHSLEIYATSSISTGIS